jgi:hypothetical protein
MDGYVTVTRGGNAIEAPPAELVVAFELKPVLLEIVETSPPRPTQMVGQRMSLEVRSKPPGYPLTDIVWTISPEVVKDYKRSVPLAVRVELTDADRRKAAISFYWISEGPKSVSVLAKLGAAQRAAVHPVVKVVAPTDVTMKSTTSTFSIGPVVADDKDSVYLVFHRDLSTPGIKWNFTATLPIGGQGKVGATQLIKGTYSTKPIGKEWKHEPTGPGWSLDPAAENRHAPLTPEYGYSPNYGGGQVAPWTDEDSPAIHLKKPLEAASVRLDFQIYFMYKATPATYDDTDSIWVTLGRLDWECAASTVRVFSSGARDDIASDWAAPQGVVASKNPTGVKSVELPTWNHVVSSFK